jgi:pimeloyl-ACP methyl ester carboxylesterase
VRGEIVEINDVYGTFYAYVPNSLESNSEIVVLAHGTPAKDTSARATARYYVSHWRDFAEKTGSIVLAPAFSDEDFSSRRGDRALSGYRGLFGRHIGADKWVLRLAGAYGKAFGILGEQLRLYGHSAGGQFAARFLVTHPRLVKRAVITAAATYPQPTVDVAWPWGMGELHTEISWDDETSDGVDIVPSIEVWLAATQVPLTVIVGLEDTAEQLPWPGQKGTNRFTIGRNWVNDMAGFAAEHGLESQFEFVMIPGKGHSMIGLASYSQSALADGTG